MRGPAVIAALLLLLLPGAALYLNAALDPSAGAGAPAVAAASAASAASPAPATPPRRVGLAGDGAPVLPALTSPPLSPAPAPVPAIKRSSAPGPRATSGTPAGSLASAAPTRPNPWVKAPLLEKAVAQAMEGFSGEYSVIVHEVGTGNHWSLNPNQLYHPASTIKMPVTLYALEQFRAGKINWQTLIEYTPEDFESPGGGAFETAPFGGLYPVENLVGRALRYSNNVAVNMLGRYLGWQNIEAWTKTIGGDLTREGSSPRVTPMSELGWWLHLEKLSREDPKNAELLLQPLQEVAYDGRITAGLPSGVPHVHKFGSYDGNYHDGALILTQRPYILIVMTNGAEEHEADAAIARLSAEIYKAMIATEA